MNVNYTKQYADACVQTSPRSCATRVNSNQDVEKTSPTYNRLKRVTYNDEIMSGIYLNSPGSGRVYPRTPVNRMKPQLPYNHPNQLLSPLLASQVQRRIVSLPEDLAPNKLAEKLANSFVATSRNVSMPAAIHHFPQIEISHDDLPFAQMSPSTSYEEENSQLHYYHQEDMPHTPSFSSNSESIEIIDNCSIYENLIRVQGHLSDKGKATHKDWITWSNSPPRPIPALHGPSSLPYARCPSGAEGTVIEEPSIVPGLIWGLRGNAPNAPLDRHRMGSGKATAQPYSGNESAYTTSCTATHVTREPMMGDFFDQQQRTHPFEDKSRVQSSKIPNGSNAHEQSIANGRHYASKQPLGECTNRHERMSFSEQDLVPHYSRTRAPSVSEKLDCTHPQPDKEDIAIRNYHDSYRATSVADYYEKQPFPNTVYSSILREPECFNEGSELNTSHSMISPGHPRRSNRKTETTNGTRGEIMQISEENIPRVDDTLSCAHLDVHGTRHKHRVMQNVLPTPPDSTSPLWSSGPSPQLEGPAFSHSQLNGPRIQKPFSQSFGLNIHAPPASLEELSDQLRQLILQQVNYDTMISRNHDTGHTHIAPPTQEKDIPTIPPKSVTKSTSMTNSEPFKPTMPISLQDLVARQTTNQTSAMESPALITPTLPVAIQSFDDTALHSKINPAVAHDSFPIQHPSKDDYEYRAGRGDVLTGRRHPRSIPLSRLLEKKLASVPEETSFTNTTFEASPPAIRPALSPVSTAIRPAKKMDYDFVELPSPVVEASTHGLLNSQIESAGLEADRKAVGAGQPKQKKRQTKAKAPAGASKNAKTNTTKSDRRSGPNDENIHLTGPPASASKKKQRSMQKSVRVEEPAKRNADQQKARR